MGIIFPLFDADGIRLTSLRVGPPSAVTYANWLLRQGGRPKVAFQSRRGDAEFDAGQSGQIAHYMLRWNNTRSERGPWSETVSATIGA